MEQFVNNNLSAPSQPPKDKVKKLLLLEIGLFEVVFTFIILFIIFAILNYFNILPLNKAIPFLRFLPQQSMGSNMTPYIFAGKKDNTALFQAYFNNTIKQDTLPVTYTTKQVQTNLFSLDWPYKKTNVALKATVAVNENNQPLQFTFSAKDTYIAVLDSAIAQKVTSKYFLTDMSQELWKCSKDAEKNTVCEYFKQLPYGKSCTLVKQEIQKKKYLFIINSLTLPMDPAYEGLTTCLIQNK